MTLKQELQPILDNKLLPLKIHSYHIRGQGENEKSYLIYEQMYNRTIKWASDKPLINEQAVMVTYYAIESRFNEIAIEKAIEAMAQADFFTEGPIFDVQSKGANSEYILQSAEIEFFRQKAV